MALDGRQGRRLEGAQDSHRGAKFTRSNRAGAHSPMILNQTKDLVPVEWKLGQSCWEKVFLAFVYLMQPAC